MNVNINPNNKDKPFHDDKNHYFSKKYLETLLENIPDEYDVSIKSSDNIDQDYMYLCQADELILSNNSAFGLYAKHVNSLLKDPKSIQTRDDLYNVPINIENNIYNQKIKMFVDKYNKR